MAFVSLIVINYCSRRVLISFYYWIVNYWRYLFFCLHK